MSLVAAMILQQVANAGVITSIVETGGDGGVTAKFSGQSFTGIAPLGAYTVPPFSVLAKCYVDRTHAYTNYAAPSSIPSYLLGNDYIMIRNDNRENTGFRIDVTVSQDVLVYVLIDNRLSDGSNANPPFNPTPVTSWPSMTWVGAAGFRPVQTGQNRTLNATLPDEVGIDESADGGINNFFSVYSNRYPAGTFSLNQQGLAGNNMYGVVVQAVSPAGPPAAPANLAGTAADAQATLTWSAAGFATGYNVYRSSTSGSGYALVGSVGGTGFTNTGLANATDYFYVVTATNAFGESTNSLEVVIRPNPVVVGIVATIDPSFVLLEWDALAGAVSYSVLRATAPTGPFTVIDSGLTETAYFDNGLPAGRTFYYRISASLGAAGQSGQSATLPVTTPPTTPTGLTVRSFGSTGSHLRWTNTDQVVSFIVERSTDGVNFAPVLFLPSTVQTVVDTNLSVNTTYYYRVQATNAGGASGYSNIGSNTTPVVAGFHVNFGAGANNSANAGLISPIPQGYLNDIGDLFGDRTNGFFYGWTNAAGTNITRDARYRQNVNSPDLRYDTFNHNQKSPGGAVWEFQITNGLYTVRIVGGDPTAVDSTFQYLIEGVLTGSYVPVANAWWADFTVSVVVEDGKLTIAPGPISANSKINFVDVIPFIPVPIVFATQPQNVVSEEFRPVSMSVTLSQGSTPISYQWYFNDSPLDGATNQVLFFRHVDQTNAGSYYLIATNHAGAATSQVATITVTPDTEPPYLVSVSSLDGISIGLCFSEELNPNTGVVTETGNYQINDGSGASVAALEIRPDGKTIRLILDEPISGPFTVAAFDMPDYAGNSLTSETNGTVMGFTAGDVGGPAFPGSNFTCDGEVIEIVGGGGDIWGAGDQGYLATRTISGNFDARIRVIELRGSNAITKGVLVARETTESGSAALHLSVNPPAPQRNQIEMGLRPAFSNATVAVGASFIPVNIPNGWMRLVRDGDVFTGYRSSNGVDWVQLGQTNVSLAPSMQVGFGVTAHDNSLLATGKFSNLTITQPAGADVAITKSASTNTVYAGQHVDYVITVTNSGPDAATGVQVADALSAGGSIVTLSPSQGTFSATNDSFTWTVGTLAPNASATINVFVAMNSVGFVTNSAVATSSSSDPVSANNSAAVVVQVLVPPTPLIGGLAFSGGIFSGSFGTVTGLTYEVQYSHSAGLSKPCIDFAPCPDPPVIEPWFTLTNIPGDGMLKTFVDPNPPPGRRFYRVQVH
jgi:uncharacterized repeat protein (TIGR01451 family)